MSRLVVAVSSFALLVPVAGAGTVAEAHITSGRSQGLSWELRGGAWRDGSFCVAILIRGRERGRACGNVRKQGGIGYMAGMAGNRGGPNYVIGAVVTKARSVTVEFFDRPPLRLGTIQAPPTLEGGVRFFVSVKPCPAKPKKLVARDAGGRVVAHYSHRDSGPKWPC